MLKIAHFGDSHILLAKRHQEYKEIFDKIFDILRKEKPDIIYHGGDILHNKTVLSPEAIQLTSYFFSNLASIAPLYICAGNHDCSLTNKERLDSITPIVEALKNDKIIYLKEPQEVEPKTGFIINSLSIFYEPNEWKKISDPNKVNIALYHGSVSGVETDSGYVLEHGDIDFNELKDFDYGLFADIHKTNQKLDKEGRFRYCGSTIQQNHSETNDKGFLIWEIFDKQKYSVKHISIPNPSPFISVELKENGDIPDTLNIPDNAKVRLISNTHISPQSLKKSIDIVKKRFNTNSITIHNRPGKRISIDELEGTYEEDNLRDLMVQEKLIEEFLKGYKLERIVLNKVFELNKKYNILAEQTEEVARNVFWKFKRCEWNNTFNYRRKKLY